MTRSLSPYMEWAKTRPRPAIDLAGSNLLPCALADLPGAREAVDIAGESPEGYPPLRKAIATRYGVMEDQVAAAGGCSGANFLACAALIETGDDVLVENPFYDPLPAAARMLGARVTTFARRFEDGFDVDPDAIARALTPRTRLVMLSNPYNPGGTLASEGSLAAVAKLGEKRGFRVLVDEVYLDTIHEQRPSIAARLSPVCISTSSLTKAYGLPSLRCGWAIAAPEVAARIRRARDVVDGWAPIPADRLSVVAFDHLDALAARARQIVQANGDQVGRFLSSRAELEFALPRSTLAFPRLRGRADAEPFVDRLLRVSGTAVAPGRFFGAPAHFRIAFGGAPEVVGKGLAAIGRCLEVA